MAKIGNRNVKVLRVYANKVVGTKVELTRKMTIAGKIIYAVVVTNTDTGVHRLIKVFDRIIDAWGCYKKVFDYLTLADI